MTQRSFGSVLGRCDNNSQRKKHLLNEIYGVTNTVQHIRGASYPGCRNNPASGCGHIEGCEIPACVKEHGVDFCAECDNFPCHKISRDKENSSRQIQEVGIDASFEERKDVSMYIHNEKG